jgi:hypothetical protein
MGASVTMMSRIGWASGSSRGHTPSASNMRREASVMAEARPSKLAAAVARIAGVDQDDADRRAHRAAGQRQRRGQPVQPSPDDGDIDDRFARCHGIFPL